VAIESQSMTGTARAGGVPSALVLAVESQAGWSANRRFSSSVLSAVEGQLPFYRYFGAGRRAAALGIAAGVLERSVQDWVRTSFHPLYGFLLGLNDPRRVVDCLTAYNSRDMGRAWELERDSVFDEYAGGERSRRLAFKPPCWALSSGRQGSFRLSASRISPDGFDDPRACQIVSLASIEYAVGQAQRRADGMANSPRTLSGVARDLGAERSAAAEAIWIFEREGGMPVESLAGRLGCKKRTLERELQAVGLTAGKLRLAGMVVGASKQLHGAASLTQIAADQGFSDLAHMTRVFKASCGMSPSALRGSPYHGRANSALR